MYITLALTLTHACMHAYTRAHTIIRHGVFKESTCVRRIVISGGVGVVGGDGNCVFAFCIFCISPDDDVAIFTAIVRALKNQRRPQCPPVSSMSESPPLPSSFVRAFVPSRTIVPGGAQKAFV